eukprot:1098337_1
MCIYLFESHNDNEVKVMSIDPVMVQFKTLDTQKVFVYESDFDTNGVCYAIGSNYGQKEFTNPHSEGLITINAVRWNGGKAEQILGRVEQSFACNSNAIENSWFSVDFGANVMVKPTHYTLRHDNNNDHFLRSWNFEGSNNGENWNILKQHDNDTSLNTAWGTHTWSVECDESYKMFRIHMMAKNTNENWHLLCAGFEIYGVLFS